MKKALLAVLCMGAAGVQAQDQVVCHYTYGGETHTVVAQAQPSAYKIEPIQIGSYFLFRVVFESQPAELAAAKIYTYVDLPDGPALIHQATYPYPAVTRGKGPYGFTGLQSVYEPVRDSELQYWCEMVKS